MFFYIKAYFTFHTEVKVFGRRKNKQRKTHKQRQRYFKKMRDSIRRCAFVYFCPREVQKIPSHEKVKGRKLDLAHKHTHTRQSGRNAECRKKLYKKKHAEKTREI